MVFNKENEVLIKVLQREKAMNQKRLLKQIETRLSDL